MNNQPVLMDAVPRSVLTLGIHRLRSVANGDSRPELADVVADELQAALLASESRAIEQPVAVPDGMCLVPIEPTQAMCIAGQDKAAEWPRFPLRINPIYRAMIAAYIAQPVPQASRFIAWDTAQGICDLPEVDETIRALIEDNTGDNATGMVRAIVEAYIALLQPVQPAAQSVEDARDAERYRQIRNPPYSDNYGDLYAMSHQGDGDIPVKGLELDRVVDAAIAAEGGKQA